MIIYYSEELFPHANLTLTIREYLNIILPKRFINEGNCREYEFIREFINFISPLLNYDTLLKKNTRH